MGQEEIVRLEELLTEQRQVMEKLLAEQMKVQEARELQDQESRVLTALSGGEVADVPPRAAGTGERCARHDSHARCCQDVQPPGGLCLVVQDAWAGECADFLGENPTKVNAFNGPGRPASGCNFCCCQEPDASCHRAAYDRGGDQLPSWQWQHCNPFCSQPWGSKPFDEDHVPA